MANTLRGQLISVEPIKQISENFRTRNFSVKQTHFNPDTGEKYENYVRFQLLNKHCDLVDGLTRDTVIEVSYNLRGNLVQKEDGTTAVYTNINAWKIELVETTQGQQSQPFTPAYNAPAPQQEPQSNYPNESDLPF